jgi:phage replication initiation protein
MMAVNVIAVNVLSEQERAGILERVGQRSRIIYDYLSICFHKHDVFDIIALLGFESMNWQETTGAHGYRDRLYSECVSIHFNGREDMGVWLELTGKGCRIFEKFGNGDYDTLLNMCLNPDNGMNLARLDVAFDDFDGILNIKRIYEDTFYITDDGKPKLKNVVTRYHEDSFEPMPTGKGISVKFGSPQSKIRVRIYDKNREQGYIEGRHWLRVELQMRHERALGFVKAAEHTPSIGARFRGVLANYVRFVEPCEDSNKRRWPTADYWARLLDSAQAISIYSKPSMEYKLEQLKSYVVRQAGNAIAAYIQICGIEDFQREIKERGTMPNPKYEAIIKGLETPDAPMGEPTPEEIYERGFEFVMFKDFDSNKTQIIDYDGYRWVLCEICREIRREDETVRIGGTTDPYGKHHINHGRCKDCAPH